MKLNKLGVGHMDEERLRELEIVVGLLIVACYILSRIGG